MPSIRIGSTDYLLVTTKPSSPALKCVKGGATYYGNLTTNKPSTKTMKFQKGNAIYYLNQPYSYPVTNVGITNGFELSATDSYSTTQTFQDVIKVRALGGYYTLKIRYNQGYGGPETKGYVFFQMRVGSGSWGSKWSGELKDINTPSVDFENGAVYYNGNPIQIQIRSLNRPSILPIYNNNYQQYGYTVCTGGTAKVEVTRRIITGTNADDYEDVTEIVDVDLS